MIYYVVNTKQKIFFRDVNSVQTVQKYPNLIKDALCVYFKTDILRFLLMVDLLTNSECELFVYTDLNVEPINKSYLLGTTSMKFLNKFGIMFLRHRAMDHWTGGFEGFENKFMAAIKDVNVIQAIYQSLLNSLNRMLEKFSPNDYALFGKTMDHTIYDGIKIFFINLLHLKNIIKINDFDKIFGSNDFELVHKCYSRIEWYHYFDILNYQNNCSIYLYALHFVTIKNYYNDDDYQYMCKKNIKN